MHRRVIDLLAAAGVVLETSRLCLHHPRGVVPELSGPCACRKPAPGMLLDAAACLGGRAGGSWMVGDTDADVGAGPRRRLQDRADRAPGQQTQALERHSAGSAGPRDLARGVDLMLRGAVGDDSAEVNLVW